MARDDERRPLARHPAAKHPALRRAPGLGDRWLAGEALPGVRFGLHDAVRVVGGEHDGRPARVLLLARVTPVVEYVIGLDDGGELRVREAALASA